MRIVLFPVLISLAAAGPVSLSGSASISGEYGWVTGDSLVERRSGRIGSHFEEAE